MLLSQQGLDNRLEETIEAAQMAVADLAQCADLLGPLPAKEYLGVSSLAIEVISFASQVCVCEPVSFNHLHLKDSVLTGILVDHVGSFGICQKAALEGHIEPIAERGHSAL